MTPLVGPDHGAGVGGPNGPGGPAGPRVLAVMPADIAEAVRDRGHHLISDGIRFERWTCTDCDRAVVRNVIVHGSAVRENCGPRA